MPIIEDNPHDKQSSENFPEFDPDLVVDLGSNEQDFVYYICLVQNAKNLSSGVKNSKISEKWPLMEEALGHQVESVSLYGIEVQRPSNVPSFISSVFPDSNIIRYD